MVKKKSHEEKHEESVHEKDNTENQSSAGAATPEQNTVPEQEQAPAGDDRVEDLTRKLTEMQDRYLRLSAEFDNYRKRTLREKIDLTKSAGESVLLSILPVIDDFDRAMNSLRETENGAPCKHYVL